MASKTLRFELVRAERLLVRQQIVAREAVLDVHDIADAAKFLDSLEQDDFHVVPSLLHDIGKQADVAGALDRLRQLTLLLGGNRGDAARDDLATLGHEALQQADVLVIDLRGVLAGERAALAAAEKCTCHRLGLHLFGTGSAVTTIATVSAIPAVTTKTAAVAIATRTALAVTLATAHHRGRAGLMLVDADGEEADDVLVDVGLALQLGNRRGRRIEIESDVVRLAILGDAIGQVAKTQVSVLTTFPPLSSMILVAFSASASTWAWAKS